MLSLHQDHVKHMMSYQLDACGIHLAESCERRDIVFSQNLDSHAQKFARVGIFVIGHLQTILWSAGNV